MVPPGGKPPRSPWHLRSTGAGTIEIVTDRPAFGDRPRSPELEVRKVDTGMIRKIDDLGRIVIPAETRRILNIHEGDELAIAVEGDQIILRKREATVAVGGHMFELDRNAVAEWERKLTTDVGSKEAAQIEAEIRRRLGL